MIIKEIEVKNVMTKSNLPVSDFSGMQKLNNLIKGIEA